MMLMLQRWKHVSVLSQHAMTMMTIAMMTATLRRTLMITTAAANRPLLTSPLYQYQHHQQQQLRYASKKRNASKRSSNDTAAVDDDEITVPDHPVPVIAKGKKARAAGQVSITEAMEQFNLDKLEASMDNAVERLQRELKSLVGRVEHLSPGGRTFSTFDEYADNDSSPA